MTNTQTEFILAPSRQRLFKWFVFIFAITIILSVLVQLALGMPLRIAVSTGIGAAFGAHTAGFFLLNKASISIENGFLEGPSGRKCIGIPLQNLDLERTISHNAKRKFLLNKVIWSTDNQKIVLDFVMYNDAQYEMLLEKLHSLVKQEE